jgi:hypothetical protein
VTFVLLFLVAVGWAIYLASWLRSRSEHRSVNSISSFNKHLSVLERTSPTRVGLPAVSARRSASQLPPGYGPVGRRSVMSLDEARKRRRDVLFALVGAALVTLVAAVLVGGAFVWLHLLADVLVGGYVVLLVRAQRLAVERRTKVRYLAPAMPAEVPYLVTQSASAN